MTGDSSLLRLLCESVARLTASEAGSAATDAATTVYTLCGVVFIEVRIILCQLMRVCGR